MERVAFRLWTMAVLIDRTIGETYLRAPRNYGSFPDTLRFLPARGDVRNSSRGRARAYSHRRRPNAGELIDDIEVDHQRHRQKRKIIIAGVISGRPLCASGFPSLRGPIGSIALAQALVFDLGMLQMIGEWVRGQSRA